MRKEKNTLFLYNVDRSDGMLMGGLSFKVNSTNNFTEAYQELKSVLESEEIVNHIIDDRCLDDDLFDCDDTFKFLRTYWDLGFHYVFINSEGIERTFSLESKFIYTH